MALPLRARLLLPAMLALASACGDDTGDDAADSVGATSAVSTSSSPETADSTGAGGCGDMCGLNDVCVISCGCLPPGTCFQRPEIGDCGQGTLDVGGSNCCADAPDPQACMKLEWCRTGPCTPDPPACVPEDDLTCNDGACEVDDGCMGELNGDGDLLTCEVCE